MPQSMAQLNAVLKEVYEGQLNDQLNNAHKAYDRIQSTGKGVKTNKFGGKYVEFAIHVGRNQGIGARDEMEALPNAGRQRTALGRVGMKNQYAGIQITGQVFALATKDYQTFNDAVQTEINRIKDDIAMDRNRQYFGDGTGTLATLTVANGAGATTLTVSNLRYFGLEQVIDIYSAAGALVQAGLTVTAINDSTSVITVTPAVTAAGAIGQILVRTKSYGKEWTGLGKIVSDTGVLYNIDPAVEPVWKSQSITGVGALSEAVMKRMADRITKAGGKTDVIWTTTGIERAYWQLLSSQRRFVNPKDYAGGYTGLEFNAGSAGPIPMLTDYDAPAGTMIYLNESQIRLYRDKEWAFMDRDGSMWQRVMDSNGRYDAYLADLFEYSELGTWRRNTHGRISGITEDAA